VFLSRTPQLPIATEKVEVAVLAPTSTARGSQAYHRFERGASTLYLQLNGALCTRLVGMGCAGDCSCYMGPIGTPSQVYRTSNVKKQ
jgi:hypothetical protein